jgi:integrase/recombinase XerD
MPARSSIGTIPLFRIVHDQSCPPSISPYRILDSKNQPVRWVNDFLDAQHVRGLSPYSLSRYGYDLLNFLRWWSRRRRPPSLSALDESRLLDYVRYELDRERKPSPSTINHRLGVIRALYRFYYQKEIPRPGGSGQSRYRGQTPLGFGRSGPATVGLRLRQPRQIVIPLRADEVSQFWCSFRSFRDFSLVGLMLFNGLRSRECIHLKLDDLRLSEAQILVHGKGNRQRILPLADDIVHVLTRYLEFERPNSDSSALFLSLKGRRRGQPMTRAGLRSLFRHHRRTSHIFGARPHRFRHTFGADMIRAGVSVPALMRLMGHSQIRTTMLYVELSPQDVWHEYHRALEKRSQALSQLRGAVSHE